MEAPFSYQTRAHNVARLETDFVDVLVIGAGIVGAGIAREAAMRGLKTAIVDRRDFGSGATSHCPRLLAGDRPDTDRGQLQLAHLINREGRRLVRIAPHLVLPVSVTVPRYKGSKLSRPRLITQLLLYNALALVGGVPRHRWLGARAVRAAEPNIRERELVGGTRYWDSRCDDARLTLAVVRSAHRHGALAANYVEVESFDLAGGRVGGARAIDVVSGRRLTIHALSVVNAAGRWSDQLAFQLGTQPNMRLSRTVQIAVARHRLGNNGSMTMTSPIDGSAIHILSWDELSYITALDVHGHGSLEQDRATGDEVVYLLRSVNSLFPHARLAPADVLATQACLWAGVASDHGTSSSVVGRSHLILEHESGLISVRGGQTSTHMVVAAETVDRAARALHRIDGRPIARRASSGREPLPGGEVRDLGVLQEEVTRDGFSNDVAEHLVHSFGSETPAVTRLAMAEPRLAAPVAPGSAVVTAELVHAMRREMAITLGDLLMRRTRLFYEAPNHATEQIDFIANLAAREMAWDAERRAAELAAYRAEVDLDKAFRSQIGVALT